MTVRGPTSWTPVTAFEVAGAVGRGEFDFEGDGRGGFVGFGPVAGHTQCLRDAHLYQGAGVFGGHVDGRVAAQTSFDLRGHDIIAEQLRDFAAGGLVAGDEDGGYIPAASYRRQDAAFADERIVDPGVVPGFGGDGVAEHAVGRSGHRVRAEKEDGIVALLIGGDVTRPGIAKDVLRPRFQALRLEAFEAIRAARAVTIDDDDLSRPCRPRPAYRRVHLIGIEPSALLVEGGAAGDLFPGFDAGDALHIAENDYTHNNHYSLSIRVKITPLSA